MAKAYYAIEVEFDDESASRERVDSAVEEALSSVSTGKASFVAISEGDSRPLAEVLLDTGLGVPDAFDMLLNDSN